MHCVLYHKEACYADGTKAKAARYEEAQVVKCDIAPEWFLLGH
jgi:hypothetical protein